MSKRLGNAADPFDCQRYGPDAHDAGTWYRINPWDNLKFDWELLRCVVNSLEHLYTYSFFSLYANIDGSNMKQKFQ
jgi:isoleucyl-tRNA synthetase